MLPAFVFASVRAGVFSEPLAHHAEASSSLDKPLSSSVQGSTTLLLILTTSGLAAIYFPLGSVSVLALGLCNAVALVWAFQLFSRAQEVAQDEHQHGGGVIYSANGLLTQPVTPQDASTPRWVLIWGDVAVAAGVSMGVAALAWEGVHFGQLHYDGPPHERDPALPPWFYGVSFANILLALASVITHMGMFSALLLMVCPVFRGYRVWSFADSCITDSTTRLLFDQPHTFVRRAVFSAVLQLFSFPTVVRYAMYCFYDTLP